MNAYDLAALLAHREALEALDVADRRIVALEPSGACRSVALLPGSFNPPTAAHLLLAERAVRERFDCVVFVLARRTAGKEAAAPLLPEDRLLALRMVTTPPAISVAVVSCGLYADQAEAAAAGFPGASIAFLVGSDKVAQIFDPAWYDDRDRALDRLFAHAELVVAPRTGNGRPVEELLDEPSNRPYADRVSVLPLHPAVNDLSSTRVRGLLKSGADPTGLVPPAVAAFLHEVRAFAPPLILGDEEVDAYELRARLLDALWPVRRTFARDVDLAQLMRVALEPAGEGRRLRSLLSHGEATEDDLARAQEGAPG